LEKRKEKVVNEAYIADFLKTNIAPNVLKMPQGSKLTLKDNTVQFDGEILRGKELNIPLSTTVIAKALRDNIDEVELASNFIEPPLQISDDLKLRGIKEILAIGESDFSGSSEARIFNFWHGASRFQGRILPKGADISFNSILGEVGAHTGYKKELVIKGDETLPDWGGGICQVSSTLYRGVMLAGLPILERSNHSYSVSYYSPAGSDATIYPGSHDLRFKNDTDGDITIQTHKSGTKLYFVLLGTKSQGQIDLFGPYITNPLPTPPTKFLPSKVLAAHTKLLISPAH
jgi:vancomycin resistance protein YoaR